MKLIRLCHILLLCTSVAFPVYAGEDEIPASVIPWYNIRMLESPFGFEQQYADTTHTAFQLYDFFYPQDPFVATKGNVGHASRRLQFEPDLSSHFQLFKAEPYMHNRFLHNHLHFYRPSHVFTDLFYVTGANREQLFYGKHAQRFDENIYGTGNYRLINSPGEFSRMGARTSNVYLTFDFRDDSDRYQLLASFISNRFENQESGGLKNHLAYEENPVRDSVFLYRAMSRYRETAVHVNHFYRTGYDVFLEGDDGKPESRFVNLGRINHNLSFVRRSFVFDEQAPPTKYFESPPINPTYTFDSTFVMTLENQLSWSNFPKERDGASFPFNFRLSIAHRYVSIKQPFFEPTNEQQTDEDFYLMMTRSFNQFIPGITIESDKTRFLSFDAFTRLTIGGYTDEDFDLGGQLYLGRYQDRNRFRLSARLSVREAPYFMSHFSGNYISWDEGFDKSNIVHVSGAWQHPLFELKGQYYLLNNMVFLNQYAIPEQNSDLFSVASVSIAANPGFGILQTRNRVVMQYVSTDHYERFPSLISYHSLFADFSLFDQALFAQVGFDLTYNAPYNPMAYMPVFRMFHVQDDYNSGHVFLLDAFLTAKIKRTRFFLKLQNMLGLLPNATPIYAIPFYPLPEAPFKFGVSWMFFN